MVSRTFDGSVHDKKITDEQPLCLPAGITLWRTQNFGTQPSKCDCQDANKKAKGKQLAAE
jgi:hypothetical protein